MLHWYTYMLFLDPLSPAFWPHRLVSRTSRIKAFCWATANLKTSVGLKLVPWCSQVLPYLQKDTHLLYLLIWKQGFSCAPLFITAIITFYLLLPLFIPHISASTRNGRMGENKSWNFILLLKSTILLCGKGRMNGDVNLKTKKVKTNLKYIY